MLSSPPHRGSQRGLVETKKAGGHGNLEGAIATIAPLAERRTEDLKVPGSIPGLGNFGKDHACHVCSLVFDHAPTTSAHMCNIMPSTHYLCMLSFEIVVQFGMCASQSLARNKI